MATMQWSDEWGLGVAELDKARRELVGCYNDIFLALRQDQGGDALRKGLGHMLDQAEALYRREEDAMEACGFSERQDHRIEHRDFIARMRRFEDALAEGRLSIDLPVLQFIRHWLTGHISEKDGEFGRFLARHPDAAANLETLEVCS